MVPTQAGPLTFVGLRVGVLDVGRELRENVHSGRVGLGIASRQSRAPAQTGEFEERPHSK